MHEIHFCFLLSADNTLAHGCLLSMKEAAVVGLDASGTSVLLKLSLEAALAKPVIGKIFFL